MEVGRTKRIVKLWDLMLTFQKASSSLYTTTQDILGDEADAGWFYDAEFNGIVAS